MDIGVRIDTLYALRAQRLALAKQVDELKMKEEIEKQEIMNHLSSIGLSRASGSLATAGRTMKVVPVPADWDKIFNYIADTKQFDLIQKRLGVLAWASRFEDGILVPGTEPAEVWDLSLTKASRA